MTDITSAPPNSEVLTSLVSRILHIENITWGNPKDNYIVSYTGNLTRDSVEAYDTLAEWLRPHHVTPLFRQVEDRHAVILVSGIITPQPSKLWINILLFVLTALSVLWVGISYSFDPEAPTLVEGLIRGLDGGVAFAASLLLILVAHELGHYLAGRRHNTAVTLPYFLPFPFPPFGTLGAFIQLKEPPKNKRIMLDIGIAGPLAGLVFAIPILFIGLLLSDVERLPFSIPANTWLTLEGNSILYLLMKFVVFGRWLPEPVSFQGLSPLMYWVRYFFTGNPVPIGGYDVLLHPMALAGWAGLLVTALNLIPAGQLDGGHLLYVLFGERARKILPAILVTLFLLGMVWQGWWLWALLIFVFGRFHANPLDQITTLDSRRRAIAVLGLLIFILLFTPIPLRSLLGG
ncbi:MAG: site-2 protease family protein [Chloroflexota bacterium]